MLPKQKVTEELKNYNLHLTDFRQWNGFDLIVDFYRIRSADQLAIRDIGMDRIKQYTMISELFSAKKERRSFYKVQCYSTEAPTLFYHFKKVSKWSSGRSFLNRL
ncbi:hypothetical protein [Flavobacterium sp. ACAM 123]|uniref:hypothetical protein n=1 Tax=Flavobacterium sp. ACAM 123 TaxID=1189620 RepID=UPI0002FA371D|nr:hypothetical protein [Flavobacterium sp. ACAM 123]